MSRSNKAPRIDDFAAVANQLLNRVAIRAESNSAEFLARTFVEVEQISSSLLRVDHQVMYGRRGTGKTHALTKLASELDSNDDIAIYIDLRKIGSNNGLYSDRGQPMPLRATQLLIDIIEALHNELLSKSIEDARFEAIYPYLDAVVEAATQIRVEGPVNISAEEEQESSADKSTNLHAGIQASDPKIAISTDHTKRSSRKNRRVSQVQRSGQELPRLLFGPLGRSLEAVSGSISPHRIWILFDEWSGIPIDLQPLVSDMLRRVIFPARGYTVKIAAIERRSRFIQRGDNATYLGLELGSDTAAALNLDQYLLATEAGPKAQEFFSELLVKHIAALAEESNVEVATGTWDAFIKMAFSDGAFAELVRAAEGVPRDAINIVGQAAMAAGKVKIRITDVRYAARKYYLHDKETGIAGNPDAYDMWMRLQREVVVERQSRTFLLRRNRDHTHSAILDLYDARLIHLLRSGLAKSGSPGIGYDGYSVDYGSYVHLMDEKQAEAMWEARSRPWEYDRNRVWLPDRFDESVIFTPARPKDARRKLNIKDKP